MPWESRQQPFLVLPLQLVLPRPHDPRAFGFEGARHQAIPGLVPFDLLSPEFGVLFRLRGMGRKPVHKHRQLELGEDEVGVVEDRDGVRTRMLYIWNYFRAAGCEVIGYGVISRRWSSFVETGSIAARHKYNHASTRAGKEHPITILCDS